MWQRLMDVEANSRHLGVIAIFIIASLLPHLMRKCFTKGHPFWILMLHRINQTDVFLPSLCSIKRCAWWRSGWHVIILPGVFGCFHWDLLWASRRSSESCLRRAPRELQSPITKGAEMWRRCDGRIPKWGPSCRTKPKRSEPNWSPAERVASEGPAEIHAMFMNWA